MRLALTYLTRRCPYKCEYCSLRDAPDLGKELDKDEWVKAFHILKRMDIDFNLILGNETWLLGADLLWIMSQNTVPFALYTTAPKELFDKYRHVFFLSGLVDNLSCGLDYSINYLAGEDEPKDDIERKSKRAWEALLWTKANYPNLDCQGNITMHRRNLLNIPAIIRDLTSQGIFAGLNVIHYAKDEGYDFFPPREEMEDLCFDRSHWPTIRDVLADVVTAPGLLQHPEIFKDITWQMLDMGWRCHGDPYGGPTIDADGSLRCCGYRKGTRTPAYSIWDLPQRTTQWKRASELDALDCPGCCWSFPRMYKYWQRTQPDFGKRVFSQHAGVHIDPKVWSKRRIQ